jgi:PBSX family phage portal protein
MSEEKPQDIRTDVPAVNVLIAGQDESDVFDFYGAKKRSDEEDGWPEGKRADLAKGESQALPEDADMVAGEIIEPPLPLSALVTAFEESNSLRQNVDAMSTNVDGFGFTLIPTIPLDGKEFKEVMTDELASGNVEPSEETVAAEMEKIKKLAYREKRRLRQFFSYCSDDSFIELRRQSREDCEVLGNFTWEVVRDDKGEISRFILLPFYTMRLCKKGDPIEVDVKRKTGPITYESFKEKRRFRKFVQRTSDKTVWFKEFGDPRAMSKKTGRYFENPKELDALAKEDPREGPATEVLHYKIRALRGVYGLPRWIGNILSVRGSRMAEEVNFFYFKNKAIPPMIIFVENGRLQDGAVDRLADFMKQVRGDTQKFWKIAIIEGESAEDARKRGVAWSGQPRFKIERLSSEQLKDGLFQEYDDKNRDKVGESWRMPRMLRGDVRDFNRATAEVAKAFAEEQVFQPERDRFDAWLNRTLGPILNMRFWQFKTLAPVIRDPYSLTEMVEKLVKAAILVPKEGRQIAEDIFNRDFEDLDEEWVKRPLALTIAGVTKQAPTSDSAVPTVGEQLLKDLGGPGEPIDKASVVRRLLEIRRALLRDTGTLEG